MRSRTITLVTHLLNEARKNAREAKAHNIMHAAYEHDGEVLAYQRVLDILAHKRPQVISNTITGYFARQSRPYERSLVHSVDVVTKRPICGARMAADAEFLWTNSAVECEHCWSAIANKVLK